MRFPAPPGVRSAWPVVIDRCPGPGQGVAWCVRDFDLRRDKASAAMSHADAVRQLDELGAPWADYSKRGRANRPDPRAAQAQAIADVAAREYASITAEGWDLARCQREQESISEFLQANWPNIDLESQAEIFGLKQAILRRSRDLHGGRAGRRGPFAAAAAAVAAAFPVGFAWGFGMGWGGHAAEQQIERRAAGGRALGKGPYPFAAREEQYRGYDPAQLQWALRDAVQARDIAERDARAYAQQYGPKAAIVQQRAGDAGWYGDDVHTILAEARRRGLAGSPPDAPARRRGAANRHRHSDADRQLLAVAEINEQLYVTPMGELRKGYLFGTLRRVDGDYLIGLASTAESGPRQEYLVAFDRTYPFVADNSADTLSRQAHNEVLRRAVQYGPRAFKSAKAAIPRMGLMARMGSLRPGDWVKPHHRSPYGKLRLKVVKVGGGRDGDLVTCELPNGEPVVFGEASLTPTTGPRGGLFVYQVRANPRSGYPDFVAQVSAFDADHAKAEVRRMYGCKVAPMEPLTARKVPGDAP